MSTAKHRQRRSGRASTHKRARSKQLSLFRGRGSRNIMGPSKPRRSGESPRGRALMDAFQQRVKDRKARMTRRQTGFFPSATSKVSAAASSQVKRGYTKLQAKRKSMRDSKQLTQNREDLFNKVSRTSGEQAYLQKRHYTEGYLSERKKHRDQLGIIDKFKFDRLHPKDSPSYGMVDKQNDTSGSRTVIKERRTIGGSRVKIINRGSRRGTTLGQDVVAGARGAGRFMGLVMKQSMSPTQLGRRMRF